MNQPKPHEVHQLFSDLLARGDLEMAYQVAAKYMEALDDGFLRFQHLCLAVRLGHIEPALDWLQNSLTSDYWISAWFLRRSPDLQPLFTLPRFKNILLELEEREKIYWVEGKMQALTLAPPDGQSPYPLLVALHGNGFNTFDAAQQWACASQQGWLATFPLAPHLVQYGKHWWDHHDENEPLVLSHVQSIRSQFPVAEGKLLWSGFSKGGEVAMYLALRGALGHKVFLTIGAGGYLLGEPELWRPIIEAASPEVRGVMMYSSYDLERSGNASKAILSMLEDRGIAYQFIEYEAEGHAFPSDFDERFPDAVEFLFEK
jgi:predicted esterase